MSLLEMKFDGLVLDNKPFYLISGDIHYFRIYPGGVKRRLELAKAFGLTAVQTYVPWNLHEPENGKFVFDGNYSIKEFLESAQELDLKVLLRPSPYICSEWDFGGLPYWLKNEGVTVRSSDKKYLCYVRRYYERLCREFVPYLSTNGGPIIAVALENEYGSYGNDKEYLLALRDMLTEFGVNVPFYTTDGYFDYMLEYGTLPDVWAGANYRSESEIAIKALKEFQPDKPAFIGELWSGRAIHWGEKYAKRDLKEVADSFKEALECGGFVNFYMFAGGTNFGFLNGANFGKSYGADNDRPVRYIPHTTTYEENALIDEQGNPTEKYFALRKVLWEFKGLPEPDMPRENRKTQILSPINLQKAASLWDCIDYTKAVKSATPMTMESLNQAYGYLLYRTEIVGCGCELKLNFPQLCDRADIYLDREYLGTLMRERDGEQPPIKINLPKGRRAVLEILVENMGRINFGRRMDEYKGITAGAFMGDIQLYGWECLSLPFDSLEKYECKEFSQIKEPIILRGEFKAEPGIDTFLDMRSLIKGIVFINGFNLGRYWNIGPQYTLYVPGELLKENNVIEIFEQYGAVSPTNIFSSDKSILN